MCTVCECVCHTNKVKREMLFICMPGLRKSSAVFCGCCSLQFLFINIALFYVRAIADCFCFFSYILYLKRRIDMGFVCSFIFLFILDKRDMFNDSLTVNFKA